jgi:hypothetical protein
MESDERLAILKMIEAGKVTAEEGLRLLEALGRSRRGSARPDPRHLRLLVSELGTGRRRAQLNVPFSLVEIGLRLAARGMSRTVRLAGQEMDVESLAAAIRDGGPGRVLDLTDDVENVRVEVFVE